MRVFIITKKKMLLTILALCLCVAVAVVFAGGEKLLPASSGKRELPIYGVNTTEKKISLTFNAAWGTKEDAYEILDILKKHGIETTFFVVGEYADQYPEVVKAISDHGHEIGNHSDKHPHMNKISADKMVADLENCSAKIEKITGNKPTLFRAPYGEYNDGVIVTAKGAGYIPIQWDTDSIDWKNPPSEEISQNVLKKSQPGSIVLFHLGKSNTIGALEAVIEGLKTQGYTFVKVSDLIYEEPYTLDVQGRQTKVKQADTESQDEVSSILETE